MICVKIKCVMGKTMTDELDTSSTLVSRNITVLGRRTSVRLEPEMWSSLREISKRESCKIHDICSLIQLRKNPRTSLTAAIRVFLMLYYRAASTEDGHIKAGHGNFNQVMSRARMNCETLDTLKAQGRESRAQGSADKQRAHATEDDAEDEFEASQCAVAAIQNMDVTKLPVGNGSQRAANI